MGKEYLTYGHLLILDPKLLHPRGRCSHKIVLKQFPNANCAHERCVQCDRTREGRRVPLGYQSGNRWTINWSDEIRWTAWFRDFNKMLHAGHDLSIELRRDAAIDI